MAIVRYSDQNEFDLVNSGQDCRGWTVEDQAGNELGTVSELLIDTEAGHVDSIIISGSGAQVASADIALRDGKVVVRGAAGGTAQEATMPQTGAAADETSASRNALFAAGETSAASAAGNENEITVPIVEEQLHVGKREVEGGSVRVRTEVSETPVQEQVTLREEHVHVERHAVDRPVSGNVPGAFQEGTIEITESAEVPVVSKEARVVEEVVVGKEASERVETVSDTVRRTEVEVEEVDRDTTNRR